MNTLIKLLIIITVILLGVFTIVAERISVNDYHKKNAPPLPPIILPTGSEVIYQGDDFLTYIDPFGKTRAIRYEPKYLFGGQ